MRIRALLFVGIAAALAGCASAGIYNVPPAASSAPTPTGETAALPPGSEPESAPAGGAGAALPEAPQVSAAAARLVVTSRDQRSAGNLNGAAATIERALTIEPDEAVLWIELAEIRLAQGDIETAQEMARKAMTLTNEGTPAYERARQMLRR